MAYRGRITAQDRSELPSPPEGETTSESHMRDEVYAPQDRRPTGAKQLGQQLNEMISHLENASELAHRDGIGASINEYAAAIGTADAIDQLAVARERRNIKQMLEGPEGADQQTRRALVQQDADLHTLERARGFTRTNYALLLIRNGDHFHGTQLLLIAQQLDPEMKDDPNFKRHLNAAIDDAEQLHNIRKHQSSDGPQLGPRNPADVQVPQFNPQRSQDVLPQITSPQLPSDVRSHPTAPQQYPHLQTVPATQQQTREVQEPTPQPNGPQPFDRQYAPAENSYNSSNGDANNSALKISPLDAQNRSPIEAAGALYEQVVHEKTMRPQVQQQFMQAVMNADAGLSPRLVPLMQALQQAHNAVTASGDVNMIAAIKAQDKAATAAFDRMPSEQKSAAYQLYNQLDHSSSPQERAQIEQQLVKMDPSLQSVLVQRNQAMGPALPQALIYFAQVQNGVQKELQSNKGQAEANQSAITRFTYGLALEQTGNKEAAKEMVAQALKLNVSKDPAMNEYWQRTATRLGVSQDAVQQPAEAAKAPGAVPLPGGAADTLTNTLKKFQDVVDKKGDVASVYKQLVPEFQSAIDKSDAEFLAARDQQALQQALSGRFLTRFYTASSASTAGDLQQAGSKLAEAFQAVPSQFQKAFFESPDVAALAAKVGLTKDHLPLPADSALVNMNKMIEGSTGFDSQHPISGISPENQGLRFDQVLERAKAMLKKDGMTESTKKQFEDSLKILDATFGPQDVKDTENMLRWLQNGKNDQGVALTQKDIFDLHTKINQEFVASTLGVQFRAEYANLLMEHKQYLSAEKIHRERIDLSDKLPLRLYQAEVTQLGNDVQNPAIRRDIQHDLIKMLEPIQGSGTSKDDGLLFMPISSRKYAALFYMSGTEGRENGVGIIQPAKAVAMINETRTAERNFFGIDLDKKPDADPSLMRMAKQFDPYLPDNLKKDKKLYDTYWTNPLIDTGIGVAAITAAGFLASLATKNPKYFGMALTADKTALNWGGKVALAGTTIAMATAGRHYAHQVAVGENESWEQSLIHGTAGAGSVAVIMATRAQVGKLLFRGATEEGALIRMAEMRGSSAASPAAEAAVAAAGSGKVLKVADVAKFYAEQNYKLTPAIENFMKANAETVLVSGGKIADQAAFNAVKLGLNPAQATEMTLSFMTVDAQGAKLSWWAKHSPTHMLGQAVDTTKGAIAPLQLDLATSSARTMRMRAVLGGFIPSTAGIATYDSINSLDRKIDERTGLKYTYAESLLNANYRSIYDNTLTEGFLLGFFMRDGEIARNFYAANAGVVGKTLGTIQKPFRAGGWGATTAGGGPTEFAKRSASTAFNAAAWNFERQGRVWRSYETAQFATKNLERTQTPISDEPAPGMVGIDTQSLTPTHGGAQHEIAKPGHGGVDLMKGTPGL